MVNKYYIKKYNINMVLYIYNIKVTLRTFLDETLDPIHITSGPAIETIVFRCLFSVTC